MPARLAATARRARMRPRPNLSTGSPDEWPCAHEPCRLVFEGALRSASAVCRVVVRHIGRHGAHRLDGSLAAPDAVLARMGAGPLELGPVSGDVGLGGALAGRWSSPDGCGCRHA